MADPLIIMVAPNGARRQKSDHPDLPITPAELARCAKDIRDAGASIMHLHVRDADNAHSLDTERYRAAIDAIRAAVGDDLIIQATSEAVGRYTRFAQMQMVRDLRPEAVSLALREVCPDEEAVGDLAQLVRFMRKERITPQYILYDEADQLRFEALRQAGVFENERPFVLFVLGRYGAPVQDAPEGIAAFKRKIACVSYPWAVCGFGPEERDAVLFAISCGGHIRVGFENNLQDETGARLPSNTTMVGFCVRKAQENQRPVARADDVRAFLSA